jgi:hypothetical protein
MQRDMGQVDKTSTDVSTALTDIWYTDEAAAQDQYPEVRVRVNGTPGTIACFGCWYDPTTNQIIIDAGTE